MPKFCTTPDAYRLFHEGQLALSEVESHGVRIDAEYLDRVIGETDARIRTIDTELRADPLYSKIQKRFGEKTNLGSAEQVAWLAFTDMKYIPKVFTESGERASASKAALEEVDHPYFEKYTYAQQLRKLRSTYLEGIRREMVRHDDGFCHLDDQPEANHA